MPLFFAHSRFTVADLSDGPVNTEHSDHMVNFLSHYGCGIQQTQFIVVCEDMRTWKWQDWMLRIGFEENDCSLSLSRGL